MTAIKDYENRVKANLIASGRVPTRAQYDAAGNCIYCGESGRCPGWHAKLNKKEV